MHAQSSNAFMLSLTLHVSVVLTLLGVAFVVERSGPPAVHVFELVAGPGNDPNATEAPALGAQDGQVDVKIPTVPVPHEAKPAMSPETKIPAKAPAKTEPKISYREFVKKHGQPVPSKPSASASSRTTRVPKINTRGIPDGVAHGSSRSTAGQGGTALTAAQHSAMDYYTSRLVKALHDNHEKPPGLSDLLTASVECLIGADGTISSVHIERPSGNAAFDQSCIEAFAHVGSIGPTPDGKTGTWTIAFHMVDPD
jgi:colicin import membrane protein